MHPLVEVRECVGQDARTHRIGNTIDNANLTAQGDLPVQPLATDIMNTTNMSHDGISSCLQDVDRRLIALLTHKRCFAAPLFPSTTRMAILVS